MKRKYSGTSKIAPSPEANSMERIPEPTYKVTNEQHNRLVILLEQIEALNEMLFAAVDEIEESNEGMTAYVLIGEKKEEARAILDSADTE